MSNSRQSCIYKSTHYFILIISLFLTFHERSAFSSDPSTTEEVESLIGTLKEALNSIRDEPQRDAVKKELQELAENCIYSYSHSTSNVLLPGISGTAAPEEERHSNISQNRAIHLVFDLDGTLVSDVKGSTFFDNRVQVSLPGRSERYRVLDHVPQALEHLRVRRGTKISFFSGGDSARNQELLKKIILNESDRLTAFDISYRILSKDDLSPTGTLDAHARFSDRFKKDLTKISEDLDFIILVDDIPFFVPEKQKRNVVTFNIEPRVLTSFEDFSQVSSDPDKAPSTLFKFALSEDRIAGSYGHIDAALDLYERHESSTFVEAIEKLSSYPQIEFIESALAKLYYHSSEPRCFYFLDHYLHRKLRYLQLASLPAEVEL